ncbi:MAG: CBS domain-containing protein [Desulfamplus sp.]|nr:CBS domain-containing protein [Desulfamplus sp.]
MKNNTLNQCTIGFSDDDIIEAMRDISGYLDITPSDFKEIYQIASRHALERLKNSVKAEHVMTTSVITVEEKTSLLDAAKLMAQNNISGMPVLDSKKTLSGVLSEKDFLKRMVQKDKETIIQGNKEDNRDNSTIVKTNKDEKEFGSFMSIIAQCLDFGGCLASDLKKLYVKDIMSYPPITVEKSMSIMEVAAIFESKGINRVPVLDSNSKLIGIIARSDLVQALC